MGPSVAATTRIAPTLSNAPTVVKERRDYTRYYLRGKALLHRGERTYCVYTKDMSRSGFCFLHHEQIFPCEKVSLFFLSGTTLEGTVVRCRRIDDDWNAYVYECEGEPCVSDEHRSRTIIEVPADLDEYAHRDPNWRGGKKHAGR